MSRNGTAIATRGLVLSLLAFVAATSTSTAVLPPVESHPPVTLPPPKMPELKRESPPTLPVIPARDPGPAYRLSWALDVPLYLVGGGLASAFFVLDESDVRPCSPCDRSKINGLDRTAAGNHSEGWGTVGTIATASTMLIGPLMLFVFEGFSDGLNDSAVVAEAALVSSAIQVMTSFAVKRPRPRVYGTEAPEDDRNTANATRSFFSGHTANGMAITVATAIAFFRLDRPVPAWIALTLGVLGSTVIGVSRVNSGSHFPTDVLVGFAVGTGVGIAIPALHFADVAVSPMTVEDGRGVAVGTTF
jgi:membrane-associated phospholipid phosphatase